MLEEVKHGLEGAYESNFQIAQNNNGVTTTESGTESRISILTEICGIATIITSWQVLAMAS
ncbi:MAG: hypothetical protein KIT59_04300 [Nitrosomonas sp.]|nr:hypothetical protein [Nitrosomonas sp.]